MKERNEGFITAMADCRNEIMSRKEFYQRVVESGYSPDIDWEAAYSAYIKLATEGKSSR